MAVNTTSAVLEMMKYTYGTDRILYLANQESPTWSILSREKKPVGGRGQFIMPIRTKNTGTWKGITEGGTLPTSVAGDTAEALWSLQEFTGIYDMSWKLIQDSRTSKMAFMQALNFLEDAFRTRFMRQLNSDLIDDGRGRLAILSAAAGSTTVTSRHLPRLEVGMVIDIMDDTDDDTKLTNGDSVTVTAVDPQAYTFTHSGSAVTGSAAGDYAVIEDTTDDSLNDALHMNGLLGILDSANPVTVVGNIGGINRSTAGNEYWKSVELGNSGVNRPLTEDLLIQLSDYVRIKGGGRINKYLSNLNIIRRYHEILRADTHYALNTQPGVLSGGIGRNEKGMSQDPGGDGKTPYQFGGVDWHADPYFDANVIVGLDTKEFFIGTGENEVPKPISEIFDGVTKMKETSSATFEILWYWQGELITTNPAAGGKITDVAET